MKTKCFLVVPIMFIFMLLPLNAFASSLELVTLQYPPYEYDEDGEVKGIAVEIVKEVFKRMQQPIHITLYPWARSLKKIQQGEADAIFTAYKNPERETYADYSEGILMPQIVSLFVRKDSDITFDGDLSKLSKYRFGVVHKLSYGTVFDDAVKTSVIRYMDTSSTGEMNMEKLLNNRFDILVSNKYGAIDILKKMNATDRVKELSPSIQNVPSYIAFSKKRNLAHLRDRFDKVLKEIREDGTYDRIIQSHFQK